MGQYWRGRPAWVTDPRCCLWHHYVEVGVQSCRPGYLPVWCLLGSPLGASPGAEPLGLGGYVASVPARPWRATSCIRRHGRLPGGGGGVRPAIPLCGTRSRAPLGASRCSARRVCVM